MFIALKFYDLASILDKLRKKAEKNVSATKVNFLSCEIIDSILFAIFCIVRQKY